VRRLFRIASFVSAALLAAASPAGAAGPTRPEEIASVSGSLTPGGTATSGVLHVDVKIRDGFHVNSHTPTEDYLIATSLKVEAQTGLQPAEPKYPAGKMKKFSFADKPLSVYEGTFRVDVPVSWTAQPPAITGTLDFQACTDTQCYAPASVPFRVAVRGPSGGGSGAGTTGADAPSGSEPPPSAASAVSTAPGRLSGGAVPLSAAPAAGTALPPSGAAGTAGDLQAQLASHGLPFVLLLIFLGGLALNLTPCVYPVIPLTVSFFGGQAAAGRRPFVLSTVYVLGMATMYSALGVAASLSGSLFGSALQSPWVLAAVAAVLVALALSMFGAYDLRMPTGLMQKAGARSGVAGAYGMGLLVGVVAAPCAGPVVLALVAFVAARQQAAFGFLCFFIFSLGLGLPFLFLGAFSGSLARLPRAGMWMESVKKAFGWILLAMAAYFVRPAIGGVVGAWLLPVVLAVGAVAIAWRSGWRPPLRFATAALFLAAAYFFAPRGSGAAETGAPAWKPYTSERIAALARPAVIDFSAAWCVPCRELDEKTFSDPRVREALHRRDLYKADLTRAGSPDVAELSRRYAILGVPTIVFLDAAGNERTDLRLVGFENADRFLARLEKAP